jgi:PAS domain S-box-containing protein
MEKSKSRPALRIGIQLSGLEGAGEIASWARDSGLTVLEIPDSKDAGPNLAECDMLVVSLARWQGMRHLLQAVKDRNDEIDSNPLSILVLYPIDADMSENTFAENGLGVGFLPDWLGPRVLIFQIKRLLDRRRVEEDYRYRLREREDVLRSISEVFFSVDHEFCYTFFNEKAEKIGGKPAREILGKNMWETFPMLRNTEFHSQMQRAAIERQIFISEYLGPITGDWFEMRIYPSAGGLSVLFVDITARKKAEEGLKRAQAELTAANSNLEQAVAERTAQLHNANGRLEELLYSIAHDLRSPLRSMQGFAQAFVEDYSASLDARAKEYAARMTSAAVFMDRMLSDLIELSRVTKTELHLDRVELGEAWRAAVAQHEEKIKTSQAVIQVSPALGHVTANVTLTVQILANLLGNALKFARPGVPPEIKVWTEQLDDRFLAVNVRDNGIGIDGKHHEKVFRVFERLNGSEYEGTGIGLAIARKAAERMKGSLDFTSHPGQGTVFCLKLPGQGGPRDHGRSQHDSPGRG